MEEAEVKDRPEQTIRDFPRWIAARRKFSPDSPFFSAGNLERELQAKQVSLDITEEEKLAISRLEEEESLRLRCPIAGCGAILKSLSDLESHYTVRHTATCSVCSRVFPTTRLLNLHVSERHDSFFKAKVARNYPMYECLVETCALRFRSDSQRLQHLVDKHHFPKTFRFHTKKHLSQKQRRRQKQNVYKQPQAIQQLPKAESSHTLSKGTRASVDRSDPQETENRTQTSENISEDTATMDVDVLTKAVSKLSTQDNTPSNISFGRRRNRACTLPLKSPHKMTLAKEVDKKMNDST
ncbi:hypothetical protein R1sor_013952 [Riccia sorocarpa]|uniref:C2H2-type domain-containing protein n=1 Tax=Riccia sorocarpa TaxID=122646 RepID=A0ABD3H863_9MARC